MNHKMVDKPPEGVLSGESFPRENEVDAQGIYERMKRDRIENMEEIKHRFEENEHKEDGH